MQDESLSEKSTSPIQVGRINSSVFEAKPNQEHDKPKLRGARKLNKANRISTLIDNLTTEQPSNIDTGRCLYAQLYNKVLSVKS